jgi:hypothetical protein
MKKLLYLALVLPLLLFSCKSTPVASFSTDTNEPEVGQKVLFTNNSENAKKFEWDFGDGFISNEDNPVHIFNTTGTFDVTLTAISKSGLDDQAIMTFNVKIPTLLEIQVLEYYSESPVANTSVYLYSSLNDWDEHNTNVISEGNTDANGIIVFSNLDPSEYYVDVWDETHDNYTLRTEDVGFIITPVILPNNIYQFIAWVDIYTSKGSVEARGTRSLNIKKLERKALDKRQPSVSYPYDDWQQLYNRSVGRK